MLSRSVTIALGLLGLSAWSCTAKDEGANLNPGGPVEEPHITRKVVDSGPVFLDMDADIHGKGGSTGLDIPDAGPKPDHAPLADTPADVGGLGAPCEVFAANPCRKGYGCYPSADGSGTCLDEGILPVGSQCDPMGSIDSRCIPGNTCVHGLCTGLCHLGLGDSGCASSLLGSICVALSEMSLVVGYCAWD